MNKIHWIQIDKLPARDYREIGYVALDIRDLAKAHGVELALSRNDRGEYLTAGATVDGLPFKLVGLLPFLEQETAIVADQSDAEAILACANLIFGSEVKVYGCAR